MSLLDCRHLPLGIFRRAFLPKVPLKIRVPRLFPGRNVGDMNAGID